MPAADFDARLFQLVGPPPGTTWPESVSMSGNDLADHLDRARQQLDWFNVPGLLEDAAREIRRLQSETDHLRDELDRLREIIPPMNLVGPIEPPHCGRNS
jgi:hypothetical protein